MIQARKSPPIKKQIKSKNKIIQSRDDHFLVSFYDSIEYILPIL